MNKLMHSHQYDLNLRTIPLLIFRSVFLHDLAVFSLGSSKMHTCPLLSAAPPPNSTRRPTFLLPTLPYQCVLVSHRTSHDPSPFQSHWSSFPSFLPWFYPPHANTSAEVFATFLFTPLHLGNFYMPLAQHFLWKVFPVTTIKLESSNHRLL